MLIQAIGIILFISISLILTSHFTNQKKVSKVSSHSKNNYTDTLNSHRAIFLLNLFFENEEPFGTWVKRLKSIESFETEYEWLTPAMSALKRLKYALNNKDQLSNEEKQKIVAESLSYFYAEVPRLQREYPDIFNAAKPYLLRKEDNVIEVDFTQ